MESEEVVFSEAIAKIVEQDKVIYEKYIDRDNCEPHSKLYLLGQDKKGVYQIAIPLPHSGFGCVWMQGVDYNEMNEATAEIYKQGYVPAAALRIGLFKANPQSYTGDYSHTMSNLPLYTYDARGRWSVHRYDKSPDYYTKLDNEITVVQKIDKSIILNRK